MGQLLNIPFILMGIVLVILNISKKLETISANKIVIEGGETSA
jgi:hypothetical protein